MAGVEFKEKSISDIIKERIDNFELDIDIKKTGKVLRNNNGVYAIYGLTDSELTSVVEFESNNEDSCITGVVVAKLSMNTTLVVLEDNNAFVKDNTSCILTDKVRDNYGCSVSMVSLDSSALMKEIIVEQALENMWQFDDALEKDIASMKRKDNRQWIKLNNRFNKRKR